LQKRDENAAAPRVVVRPRRTVLDPSSLANVCRQSHVQPSEDLSPFISRAWMLEWTLGPHESFVQHVLPDPCVHLIVEPAGAHVLGVVTKLFSTTLAESNAVFGLKFRPGGFYPFYRQPVAALTNKSIRLTDVFGEIDVRRLTRQLAGRDGLAVMTLLQNALRARRPEIDPVFDEARAVADRIAADSTIHSVEQAARIFATTPRSLQRLCRTYIGATPKWLIRLYRIKEAAARIEEGDVESWVDLALRLGYADQAHFINDFRSLVGQSPARYAVKASARRRSLS
jgi:AraC-like DNA-binding protein